MTRLPALVVHGWWIAKLLVVAAAAGGFGALALLRRWLVARRARAAARRQVAVAHPALLGPWLPLGLAVCALAGYFGLRAIGRACIPARGRDAPYADRLGALDPLVLAAALPGTREDALEGLDDRVTYELARTEAVDQLRVEIAELRRGCTGAVATLIAVGRADDALAREAGCPAPGLRLAALVELGRYAEAAAIASPETASLDQRVEIALATSRWRDAAAALEEAVPREPPAGALDRQRAAHHRCVVELVRWYGGDTGAPARFAPLRDSSVTCAVAHAIATTDGHDRTVAIIAAIDAHRAGREYHGVREAVELAWGYGGQSHEVRDAIGALLGSPERDRRPWFVPAAAQPPRSPTAPAWAAVWDTYRGDFAGAAHEAAELVARMPEPGDAPAARDLAIAVQLRAGTPITDVDDLDDEHHWQVRREAALRAGRGFGIAANDAYLTPYPMCSLELRRTLDVAAISGDGAPLASTIERCRIDGARHAATLLAVAPRVRTGRAELAAAVRAMHDRELGGPFERVDRLAIARDLARMLGDDAHARALQAIIDRHRAAFRTREQVAALLLALSR